MTNKGDPQLDFAIAVADLEGWCALKQEQGLSAGCGEWEDEYEGWAKITTLLQRLLDDSPLAKEWREATWVAVFHAVARDSGAEGIAGALSKHPKVFGEFSHRLKITSDISVKWQFAAQTEYWGCERKYETQLRELVDDVDEYVSRRALLALATAQHPEVEILAERAWRTEHEYQRIAALRSLERINSPDLKQYLVLAFADGRPHLVKNAQELSDTLN